MCVRNLVVVVLTLLAFNLQAVAAPTGLICANPAPEQAMQEVGTGPHAHHQDMQHSPEEQPMLNCDMGCDCGGDCVHSCQLNVLQPDLAIAEPEHNTLSPIYRSGELHQAYRYPLLRPPAVL